MDSTAELAAHRSLHDPAELSRLSDDELRDIGHELEERLEALHAQRERLSRSRAPGSGLFAWALILLLGVAGLLDVASQSPGASLVVALSIAGAGLLAVIVPLSAAAADRIRDPRREPRPRTRPDQKLTMPTIGVTLFVSGVLGLAAVLLAVRLGLTNFDQVGRVAVIIIAALVGYIYSKLLPRLVKTILSRRKLR
jgi:hypothetical protein